MHLSHTFVPQACQQLHGCCQRIHRLLEHSFHHQVVVTHNTAATGQQSARPMLSVLTILAVHMVLYSYMYVQPQG